MQLLIPRMHQSCQACNINFMVYDAGPVHNCILDDKIPTFIPETASFCNNGSRFLSLPDGAKTYYLLE